MVVNSRIYKGHKIEKNIFKQHGSSCEYYTVDGKGYFLFLKDAKTFIDKEV